MRLNVPAELEDVPRAAAKAPHAVASLGLTVVLMATGARPSVQAALRLFAMIGSLAAPTAFMTPIPSLVKRLVVGPDKHPFRRFSPHRRALLDRRPRCLGAPIAQLSRLSRRRAPRCARPCPHRGRNRRPDQDRGLPPNSRLRLPLGRGRHAGNDGRAGSGPAARPGPARHPAARHADGRDRHGDGGSGAGSDRTRRHDRTSGSRRAAGRAGR